jgi:hypothetical protein
LTPHAHAAILPIVKHDMRHPDPKEVDVDSIPGVYYIVERFGAGGWKSISDTAAKNLGYKTRIEAQWARAKLHVENKALPLSATRVVEWRWS